MCLNNMKISTELEKRIKDIILSTPYDIYSQEAETVNESVYELVDTRTIFDKDSQENKQTRYIGSVNMFIASSLVCYVLFNLNNIEDLSDEQLDSFAVIWKEFIEQQMSARFIRPIETIAREKIKVIVDNT